MISLGQSVRQGSAMLRVELTLIYIYRLSAMEVLSLINETSLFICILIYRYNW
jgi:hypothetical protein